MVNDPLQQIPQIPTTKHSPVMDITISLCPNIFIQRCHGSTGDPYFYWSYGIAPFTHLILFNVSSPSPDTQQCDKTFLCSNTDQCDNYKQQCDKIFLCPVINQYDKCSTPKPSQCKTCMNDILAIWKQQLQHTASREVNIKTSDNPPAPNFARENNYCKVSARYSKSYFISL